MNSIFLFSISLFGISSMPAQLHILLHFIVNLQSLSVFLHPASQIRFTGRFSHKTRKVVNILGFTISASFLSGSGWENTFKLGISMQCCVLCACTQCACGGIKWKERDLENPLDLVAAPLPLPPSLLWIRKRVYGGG